jgi:hypothetical protein
MDREAIALRIAHRPSTDSYTKLIDRPLIGSSPFGLAASLAVQGEHLSLAKIPSQGIRIATNLVENTGISQ